MVIGGSNLPAELAARIATAQQGYAATQSAPKNRQAAVSSATDQYRSASQPIIEAEYVDLYSPTRRPTEQQNQWRNLVVEGQDAPAAQQLTQAGADEHKQQLIARYGQNSSNLPLPGSFINLMA